MTRSNAFERFVQSVWSREKFCVVLQGLMKWISLHIVRAYFSFGVGSDRMMKHVLIKHSSSTQSLHTAVWFVLTVNAELLLPSVHFHLTSFPAMPSPTVPPKGLPNPERVQLVAVCCCEMCVLTHHDQELMSLL